MAKARFQPNPLSEEKMLEGRRNGYIPSGGKTTGQNVIRLGMDELTSRDPDSIRQMLTRDEWLTPVMKAFWEKLNEGDRWALRTYFEAIKLVGGDREVNTVIALVGDLGIKSLADLREAVSASNMVKGVTIEEAERRSLEFLQNQRRLRGEPLLIDPLQRAPEAEEV